MNEWLNTHKSYQLWISEGTPLLWFLAASSPDSVFLLPKFPFRLHVLILSMARGFFHEGAQLFFTLKTPHCLQLA